MNEQGGLLMNDCVFNYMTAWPSYSRSWQLRARAHTSVARNLYPGRPQSLRLRGRLADLDLLPDCAIHTLDAINLDFWLTRVHEPNICFCASHWCIQLLLSVCLRSGTRRLNGWSMRSSHEFESAHSVRALWTTSGHSELIHSYLI